MSEHDPQDPQDSQGRGHDQDGGLDGFDGFDEEGPLGPLPILAVVGRREAEEGKLVLRRLPGREQEALPLAEAVALLAREAAAPDLPGVAVRVAVAP